MGIYIKGFKPQDGLYVIKDGVIRKYKEKGGTVRPYELVEVKEPHGRLIDAAVEAADEWDGGYSRSREEIITLKLRMLPSAQPEIKTDGDTISRQEAIYAIVNTVSDVGLHDNSETARYGATFRQQEILTILESLPSANKSGHWVMNPSEVAGDGYYICSNCNNDVYDATDFCPNCGADMRGESDD